MPVDAGIGQGASADACGSGRGSRSSGPRSWRSLDTLAHMCGCPCAADSCNINCKHDFDAAHHGHLKIIRPTWQPAGAQLRRAIAVHVRAAAAGWDIPAAEQVAVCQPHALSVRRAWPAPEAAPIESSGTFTRTDAGGYLPEPGLDSAGLQQASLGMRFCWAFTLHRTIMEQMTYRSAQSFRPVA